MSSIPLRKLDRDGQSSRFRLIPIVSHQPCGKPDAIRLPTPCAADIIEGSKPGVARSPTKRQQYLGGLFGLATLPWSSKASLQDCRSVFWEIARWFSRAGWVKSFKSFGFAVLHYTCFNADASLQQHIVWALPNDRAYIDIETNWV